MSLGFQSIGSVANTANISAYTCTLIRAPFDNALILVGVLAGDTAGTPTEPTSVLGDGLVFSLITSSVTFDPITASAQVHNLSAWRCMGSGLTTSILTVTFSNSATGCGVLVTEVTGVPSGSSGANAVGQSATTSKDNDSAVTLFPPSALSTANGWLSYHGIGTTSLSTAGGNWTMLDRATHLTPSSGIASAYTTLASGTSLPWTMGSAQFHGGVIIELQASVTTGDTQWGFGMQGRTFRNTAPRTQGTLVRPGHTEATDTTDTREG